MDNDNNQSNGQGNGSTSVRDQELFPNDDNGNRLWTIALQGFDFNEPVEVEFSMIFPTRVLALEFGHVLLENNQKLSFCQYHGDAEYPWEITAYPVMPLSHENLSAYQSLLETHGDEFQGKYDGWFCVAANEPLE